MFNRSRLLFCIFAPLALFFGTFLSVEHVNQRSLRFFNTGKGIVETLRQLAQAVQSRDLAAVEKFYTPEFRGSRLGFTELQLVEEKDGIHRSRFSPGRLTAGRDAALAEWRTYLDSFESIEEVGIHLYRLEQWDSPAELVTT